MTAVDFRNHLVLQSKRLTTFAELRSEVADIVRSRAATAPCASAGRCSVAGRGRDGQMQEQGQGSEDTSTNQDTKRKCAYCDEVWHMQKDCQKRNSDTVSAQKHGRRHEKERKCSGSESAFVGSFDVNLLVDIEPGACGADHAPDDYEELPHRQGSARVPADQAESRERSRGVAEVLHDADELARGVGRRGFRSCACLCLFGVRAGTALVDRLGRSGDDMPTLARSTHTPCRTAT